VSGTGMLEYFYLCLW